MEEFVYKKGPRRTKRLLTMLEEKSSGMVPYEFTGVPQGTSLRMYEMDGGAVLVGGYASMHDIKIGLFGFNSSSVVYRWLRRDLESLGARPA